ncbi:hypothetical protein SLE2022_290200 [Rubroshorea leprosula]
MVRFLCFSRSIFVSLSAFRGLIYGDFGGFAFRNGRFGVLVLHISEVSFRSTANVTLNALINLLALFFSSAVGVTSLTVNRKLFSYYIWFFVCFNFCVGNSDLYFELIVCIYGVFD